MGLSSGSVGTDAESIAGSVREPGKSLDVRIGAGDGWVDSA